MMSNNKAMPHPELVRLHQRIAATTNNDHERPVFVCCLGDSVTRGWGSGNLLYHECYPTRLLGALHDRYPGCIFQGINAGVGGDSATTALARLDRDVIRYAPDVTTICFGLNDSMGGEVELPRFIASVQEIIDRLHAVGSAVILLTPNMMATSRSDLVPLPYRDQVDAFIQVQQQGELGTFVEAIRTLAHERQLPLADAYAVWQRYAAQGHDITAWLANGINHPFGFAHQWFVDALLDQFPPLTAS